MALCHQSWIHHVVWPNSTGAQQLCASPLPWCLNIFFGCLQCAFLRALPWWTTTHPHLNFYYRFQTMKSQIIFFSPGINFRHSEICFACFFNFLCLDEWGFHVCLYSSYSNWATWRRRQGRLLCSNMCTQFHIDCSVRECVHMHFCIIKISMQKFNKKSKQGFVHEAPGACWWDSLPCWLQGGPPVTLV